MLKVKKKENKNDEKRRKIEHFKNGLNPTQHNTKISDTLSKVVQEQVCTG